MTDWRPIETAPRDGTAILVTAPDVECEVTIAYFQRGRLYSIFDGKPFGGWVTPTTHWMPLPKPPTPSEEPPASS